MAKVVVDAFQRCRMCGDVTELRPLTFDLKHLYAAPFFDVAHAKANKLRTAKPVLEEDG